jgi:23S rRNA pseudouridine1911/1915/1917 synthase
MQFYNKTTHREYIALAWGRFNETKGIIRGNIGRSLKNRKIMQVYPAGERGKEAITHYEVLEDLGYVSLIKCWLETGRTHQIRVHMRHAGHPLFNDPEYGGDKIIKGTLFNKYKQFVHNCFEIIPRQALHAKTLGFVHPRTKEEMFFDSEIPDDMKQVTEKWRHYIANRE